MDGRQMNSMNAFSLVLIEHIGENFESALPFLTMLD